MISLSEIWEQTKFFYFMRIEKFISLGRKMDFYLSTSASTFPCFQITWKKTTVGKHIDIRKIILQYL